MPIHAVHTLTRPSWFVQHNSLRQASRTKASNTSQMGWWPFSSNKQPDTSATKPADIPAEKPKKKICCACPETKALRDPCIAEHGEEHPYCAALIAAHKECLRLEGFKV